MIKIKLDNKCLLNFYLRNCYFIIILKMMFLKKNIFLLCVLFLFSFNSWTEEVSCSSIQSQIDIKHSYYYPKSCYSFGGADVSAYAADFYDDQVF